MLGVSCGENTARNGGIDFWTSVSKPIISFAWERWARLGDPGPGSARALATSVISESSVLPMVYDSLWDSCSACSLFRSTGSIPQYGSRSWYIRSYSSGSWTLFSSQYNHLLVVLKACTKCKCQQRSHHLSNPFGGALRYLRLYSVTASAKVLL